MNNQQIAVAGIVGIAAVGYVAYKANRLGGGFFETLANMFKPRPNYDTVAYAEKRAEEARTAGERDGWRKAADVYRQNRAVMESDSAGKLTDQQSVLVNGLSNGGYSTTDVYMAIIDDMKMYGGGGRLTGSLSGQVVIPGSYQDQMLRDQQMEFMN